jgi:alkanesulfonate monooxygenase SsuD/methylene tetrahydromethanopterin reductase-like flavin-dependent oxidoreductase (luciferase family)
VDDPTHAERYRARCGVPRLVVAVAGICAETDAAAAAMARELHGSYFAPRVVGSPEHCAAGLGELRERYQADEIVFADLCPRGSRARCYELLAGAFQVTGRDQA